MIWMCNFYFSSSFPLCASARYVPTPAVCPRASACACMGPCIKAGRVLVVEFAPSGGRQPPTVGGRLRPSPRVGACVTA